ncbi:MAG: ATP-binding cassette domain-containing protein, partial [Devosiaceae bacterium]|nr:ATP-binding cassette domain-containing protein [Devosiaceae bacterium]
MNKNTHREILVSGLGIGVKQGQRWRIRGVDISISRGEIVTLIGPNGSGKSTVAKIITGVISPTAGQIIRADNLRIGYVPQKLEIAQTLPINVTRFLSLTKYHSPQEVRKALEMLEVFHLKNAPVQQLSGGEFQRVLLARAMILAPDLLVLDEPAQGVDYAGQGILYALVERLREQTGCGVLMVSHDLHVVMAQTDKVICLNGHVCCSGSPDVVAGSPQFLELFGQEAQQTLALYRHEHDHAHLP